VGFQTPDWEAQTCCSALEEFSVMEEQLVAEHLLWNLLLEVKSSQRLSHDTLEASLCRDGRLDFACHTKN